MASKKIAMLMMTLVVAGVAAVFAAAQDGHPAMAQGEQPALGGQAVARAYIAGMEAGDLDALNVLFVADNQSSIFENASDEGSWEHYRDHHLKPEMEVVKNFEFVITQETERPFGDAILVEHIGTFSVEIRDEQRHYRVAVSYLIVAQDDQLQIAHLHWSSRPSTPPAPAPE